MKATLDEAIKTAYGKYWRELDKTTLDIEGWIDLDHASHILAEKELEMDHKSNYVYFSKYEYKVRPASLRGIENNNRWIKVYMPVELDPKKSYDLYDAENDSIIWDVSDLFQIMMLLYQPAITHMREHLKQTPFYNEIRNNF